MALIRDPLLLLSSIPLLRQFSLSSPRHLVKGVWTEDGEKESFPLTVFLFSRHT